MNLGRLCQTILKSDKEISGYGQLAQYVIFAYHMVRQTPLIALPPLRFPDQGGSKNGRRTLKIFWEDSYTREVRVSSAVKYDCFKLDDSGNFIIRKTWLHCI